MNDKTTPLLSSILESIHRPAIQLSRTNFILTRFSFVNYLGTRDRSLNARAFPSQFRQKEKEKRKKEKERTYSENTDVVRTYA